MKSLLFGVVTLFLLQSALAADLPVPKTCEDVLPAQTCADLRTVAGKLKENVQIVNQAVTDAFNHHVTKISEVVVYVQQYLVDKATNFKCTDALSVVTCNKIVEFATAAHLKVQEANKAVREAIVTGASQVADIYNKAIAFLTSEITCEKVLGAQICSGLTTTAQNLKERAALVQEAVVAAVKNGLKSSEEILESARKFLIEKSNLKCADVLSAEQCTHLTSLLQKLKLKAGELNVAIREAVANGVDSAKGIYDKAVSFLVNDVPNFQCEVVVSADVCNQLKDFASKFHLKAKDIKDSIVEVLGNGVTSATEQFKIAKEYLTSRISCNSFMGPKICTKIQDFSAALGVQIEVLDTYLRKMVADGITSAKELYKNSVSFIVDKWTNGIFGDEVMYKRSAEDHEAMKLMVKRAIENVLDVLLDEPM